MFPSELQQYLPFLLPILILQLGLMVAALLDLLRRGQTRGPKWLWLLVIVLVNFIGPILYFVLGRKEE
ncbi:MAG: PLD nuclease N-terminal domain-containing protein [Anaerolineales bacterium]